MVQMNILLLSPADNIVYTLPSDASAVLLAKPPFDKLYASYVVAMVDFANGEYDKYANTLEMFNSHFSEYSKWYALHYRPADRRGAWAGYYVSAYAVAVSHGYGGTEEEWLATLKGERGEPGVKGDPGADGKSFSVKSIYATLTALQKAHPVGATGDAYAVGTESSNVAYFWDVDHAAWMSVGSLRGKDGVDGRGVTSVARSAGNGAAGTTDTFTIAYTDNSTSTFNIYNGADGKDGRGITSVARSSGNGAAGTTDTFTITYTDGSASTLNIYNGADGKDGRGIDSIARASGNGEAGTIDTYTITYTSGNPSIFYVRNGKNGVDGIDGTTFTPIVNADGVLSWTNDGGKQNPSSVSVKGPKGDTGNGFTILGVYESLSALNSAVTSPSIGQAYGVGSDIPYDIYIYSAAGWTNHGKFRGEKGFKGDPGNDGSSAYVHIRWGNSLTPSTLLTAPSDYIGICSSISEVAPDTYSGYLWYKYKGETGSRGLRGYKGDKGNDGRGISTVVRTGGDGSLGTLDTYTITFTDGKESTFDVINGSEAVLDALQRALAAQAAAETAQTAAESAQAGAEAAETNAGNSATAAWESATAAAGSAAAANSAKTAAQAAQAAAEATSSASVTEHNVSPTAHADLFAEKLAPKADKLIEGNFTKGNILIAGDGGIFSDSGMPLYRLGEYKPMYGVSGVGGASTTLTRLWDAAGLQADVSTDTPGENYRNDFDTLAPFNRRKCVGHWEMVIPAAYPKARFVVQAYFGDPDYTEDGTKGDYVAVEIDPLWYYQDLDTGIIGVSAGRHSGWSAHPVCLDRDGNIRNKTYLPCYPLVMVDGKAASLPGYFPDSGSYKGLRDDCRTYSEAAILEPFAVRHYEWLLFTIEFATTNCQTKMQGASSMAYSNNAMYQSTIVSTGELDNNKFILSNSGAAMFVVGQTLAMDSSAYAETYKRIITAIEDYDTDNKAIIFDGAALDVPAGWWASSRPWETGACNDVKAPSGSPVSNSDGKHPMRYRYRENIWGNLYSTCNDLFDDLAGAGTADDPYKIIWYMLNDPVNYYPASTSKPDRTDFASDKFTQLSQVTEHVNGYIKEIEADPDNPHCIVPTIQTGASASTFFCDYGYVNNGTTGPRAVRLGGFLLGGSGHGVLCFNAYSSVSGTSWHCGGGLYFNQ